MASHRVYSDLKNLEEILKSEKGSRTLFNIIHKFCDVKLDLESEEILKLKDKNPFFKKLFKRNHATVEPDKESYESLRNNKYENFLNDILIMNLEEEDTKNIRDRYGILAVNTEEPFLENQEYNFGYSIGVDETSIKNCWSELFHDKPIIPVNSAIIIDNFLWNDIRKYKEQNDNNIYPILNSIIPKTLEVPFHLMIVLQSKDGRLTKEKAKEIIKKMRKKIDCDSGLEISIITQTNTKKFHERAILTNYHYIYSHKGFVAFEDNRIKNETNGDRNWVFKDINNYVGEIRKHSHLSYSKKVLEQIDHNNKNETSVIFNEGNTYNSILSNLKYTS